MDQPASLLVMKLAEETGSPAVVTVERKEDMLLLYRKPRLTYIVTDATVQIIVDGKVSHVMHYVGNVAIDTEVPC